MDHKTFSLNDYTKWDRNMFLFIGLYPMKSRNKLKLLMHHIKCFISVMCFVTLLSSMSASLGFDAEGISDVAEILYYWITEVALIWKALNFIKNRHILLDMEKHLEHPVSYKYYAVFGTDGLESIMSICKLTGTILRVTISIFSVGIAILPLFQLEPFPAWYPFGQPWAYMHQAICVAASAWINSSMDIFVAFGIGIAVGQLRLLKTCLENIDYTNNEETINSKEKIGTESLSDMVVLHDHILDYIVMLEEMYSYGIFVQFLASIGVICFSGFQVLIIDPMSTDFIILVVYICAVMSQIVLYCWYGNEILVESDTIMTSCYMSNWYEGTTSEKKSLFIIMERSKRLVALTAGKFFTLSLATLIMILKSSYSYFAVLRQYYKDVFVPSNE